MERTALKESIANNASFDLFKANVYCFHSKAERLHKHKSFPKSSDLLDDVLDLQNEILKSFGLPETSEFISIIELFGWEQEINDLDVKELYLTLKATSENNLLKPTKSERDILIEARESNQTANDFFPVIEISNHIYNNFLYESLFYSKNYDVDEVLQELKRGNSLPSEMLSKLYTNKHLKGEFDEEVQQLGLKFWPEFVNYKNSKKHPSKKAIQFIDIVRNGYFGRYPKTIRVDEGYISSIVYFEGKNPFVIVELTTPVASSLINIRVYMPFEEAINLLKKSTNHLLASINRSMLFDNFNQISDITNELLIREWNNTYLYCKGIDLKVTKYTFEVNGIESKDHNYYEVSEFEEYLSR